MKTGLKTRRTTTRERERERERTRWFSHSHENLDPVLKVWGLGGFNETLC
jgi:hypothetical protein